MIDVPMVSDSFLEPLQSKRGDTPKITQDEIDDRCAHGVRFIHRAVAKEEGRHPKNHTAV